MSGLSPSERYDFIAINALGVYALCEDIPGDPGDASKIFIWQAKARGHTVERVTVAEAVARHRAYLALLPPAGDEM